MADSNLILTFLAVLLLRRGRHRPTRVLSAAQLIGVVEPVAVDERPDAAAMVAALAELGRRDREFLLLVGWEKLSGDEAASVHSVS